MHGENAQESNKAVVTKDAYVLEFFKKLSYCKAGLSERLRHLLNTEGHAINLDLKFKILDKLTNFRTDTNDSLANEMLDDNSPIAISKDTRDFYTEYFPGDFETNRQLSLGASGIFGQYTKHQVSMRHAVVAAVSSSFNSEHGAIDKKRLGVKLANDKVEPLQLNHFGQDDTSIYHIQSGKHFNKQSIIELHDDLFRRRTRKSVIISNKHILVY